MEPDLQPGTVSFFQKIIYLIARALDVVAQWAVVAMMLVTIASIIARPLRIAVTASFDIIVLLGPIVFVFGWAYTQVKKGHLQVDTIVSRLPQRARLVTTSVTYFFSLCISLLMVWYITGLANELQRASQMVSTTTAIPVFPVVYLMAFAIMLFALVLLIDLINTLLRKVKK